VVVIVMGHLLRADYPTRPENLASEIQRSDLSGIER
jgi:hypothetical protein